MLDIALLHSKIARRGKISNVYHGEVPSCLIVEDIRRLKISMSKAILVVDVRKERPQCLENLHQLWYLPSAALIVDNIREALSRCLEHYYEVMGIVP